MKSTALPRNLAEWLARPAKAIGARKRIPAMSPKRKAESAIYSKKKKAFLEAHPWCEAWYSIPYSFRRDAVGYASLAMTCPASKEIHHMKKPKQTYFLDESTWLAVSLWSHRWIERHKDIARKLGLLC